MMTNPAFKVLFNDTIPLDAGKEWHSTAIDLRQGDIVTVSAEGDGKFYAAFLDREAYHRRRGAVAGMFDFELGTDRRGWTTRILVQQDDEYYLVFRVSTFQGKTNVHARVVLRSLRDL